MSTLQGNAKRYNGTPIDYVLIFDWATGAFIGKSIPDATGVWSFEYTANLLCGITYVADGCEPITHGAYVFEGVTRAIPSGFLLLSMAQSGRFYNPYWDISATAEPTWSENFEYVQDVLLYNTISVRGIANIAYSSKVIDSFNINWVLQLMAVARTASSDIALLTLEFMDASDNVIAAIKSSGYSESKTTLWYGLSLDNMTNAGSTGVNPRTYGDLSFTNTTVTYNNISGGDFNNSFYFNADMARVRKVRVASEARSSSTAGSFAGSSIRLLPMSPVQ